MAAFSTDSMLHLLRGAERLGERSGKTDAYHTVIRAAQCFLRARFALMYRVLQEREGLRVLPLGWQVDGEEDVHWQSTEPSDSHFEPAPLLRECYAAQDGCAVHHESGDWLVAFAIGPQRQARWLLELHCKHRPSWQEREALAVFLRCFHNQQNQWEYANLDSLTHLLNRKTFEENFDQLITEAARAKRDRARKLGPAELSRPCWLGVIDIDHFKRVNDTYGHLFGDEVLLLVAELMRRNFRASDRLFRFGGEEFVVMIYHVADEAIEGVFDRFRHAVEAYPFPQLGRLTCSIGFTQIDPALQPAELLGHADEALYYSKQNGRNQVRNYDALLATGRLARASAADSAQHQAEADEFFG